MESLGRLNLTMWLVVLPTSACGLVLDSSPSTESPGVPDGSVEASVRDSGNGVVDGAVDGTLRDGGRNDGRVPDGSLADAGRPDAGGTDAGPLCPGTPCDLLSQCGCDDSDHCVLTDSLDILCYPPGSVAEGQPCDGYWECGRALTCGYVGSPPGVCARYCGGDADSARGVGVRCLHFIVGADMSAVGACSAGCDPIFQTGCEDLDCLVVPVDASGDWATVCGEAGPTRVGAACSYANECSRSTACVGGYCRPLCGDSRVCPGGYTCNRFAGSSSWSGDYGVCVAF